MKKKRKIREQKPVQDTAVRHTKKQQTFVIGSAEPEKTASDKINASDEKKKRYKPQDILRVPPAVAVCQTV